MKNIDIGKIGENKACEFLIKKGYVILERNYWKKFGEIDIVARAPDQTLVFIEVKTLLIKNELGGRGFLPEDNFTSQKYRKVKRMCEFFSAQHDELIDEERGWRFDLIAADFYENGEFSMRHYENV
jgi:putative endonuclease